MTIHISKDTGCNLGCSYCYEELDREITGDEAGSQSLDVDSVIEQLEKWREKYPESVPGLHGGEPLLISMDDMEEIFKWIHNNYEDPEPHIQTNGTLVTDKHIELFEEYDVQVGVSMDGPPELNRERKSRGQDGDDVTDLMSEKTFQAINDLAESDVNVGVIVVVHKTNAGTREKREKLLEWMDELNQMGVFGHFNPAIPYEGIQTHLSLDPETLGDLYVETWEWMLEEDYRQWNPMADYQDNLIGAKLKNCVNRKCDVKNTRAAKIVTGEGFTTGCGKTWGAAGDGRPFLQGPSNNSEYQESDVRYKVLKQSPGWVTEGEEDMGGCRGCKFWNVCTGGCPSSAWDNDFRNRTMWCKAKYRLYERIEEDMRKIMPNIRLITDFNWDADLHEAATRWNLDFGPFARMRPGERGPSSVRQYGSLPEKYREIDREQASQTVEGSSFEEQVAHLKEEYDEENIEIDRENKFYHVDSSKSDKPKTSFDRKVQELKQEYNEENIEIDRENKYWHVDSSGGDVNDS